MCFRNGRRSCDAPEQRGETYTRASGLDLIPGGFLESVPDACGLVHRRPSGVDASRFDEGEMINVLERELSAADIDFLRQIFKGRAGVISCVVDGSEGIVYGAECIVTWTVGHA